MADQLKCQVAVIGAGPVGMYAALGLDSAGASVRIYDAGGRRAMHSFALVLHADTLKMLDADGLAAPILKEGRAVDRLSLFEGGNRLGHVDLPAKVVVLPQSRLEALLEAALDKRGIKVQWDHRVQGIEPGPSGVRLEVAKLDKVSTGYPIAHTESVVDKMFHVDAGFVLAADGYDSFVRRRLGIGETTMGKGQLFSVFQFETDGEVPGEGCLMLEANRVGGFWPLPGKQARFSFPIDVESEHNADASRLGQLIAERAPWFRGEAVRIEWTALGMFERKLAASFGSGRVWLAGDAAHITGPLGAQSMNVGLREAKTLAAELAAAARGGDASTLERYAAARMAEWKDLLSPEPRPGDPRSQVKPCLPATGAALGDLLGRMGL